jgi:hypothetical protein
LDVSDVCDALQAGVSDLEPDDLQGADQVEANDDAEDDRANGPVQSGRLTQNEVERVKKNFAETSA